MKISVIGSGRVGSTLAFSLLSNNLMDELVLIDLNINAAKGEALDLLHTTGGLSKKVKITGSDDYSDTKDSDMAIITAGVPRKPGESRLDLRMKNIAILTDVVGKIMEHNRNPFILVVSNPVDLLTYHAWKESGLPANKVFGLGTSLDTLRLRSLLLEKYGPEILDEEVYVLGEHGDSMFPVFSHMKGSYDRKELDALFQDVRDGGIKVINLKGGTWFAPAMPVTRIVDSIVNDRGASIPVSVYQKEFDLFIGSLAVISASGVEAVDFQLNEEENAEFRKSIDTIRKYVEE